jgi:hypothetical protein
MVIKKNSEDVLVHVGSFGLFTQLFLGTNYEGVISPFIHFIILIGL